MHIENVYWDWSAMQRDGLYPSILAIGDSWFWYPLPGGSLINQLGRLVAEKEHAILALGNNGAEAYDYVYGKYSKAVKAALRLHGASLSAVFLSGGGNDFAGFNDLRPLLHADCSHKTSAPDCFRPDDGGQTLDWLMRKTGDSYRTLIGQVLASAPPATSIFLHNYDYAWPNGKGVFGRNGSWLKPALDDAQVPQPLQRDCVKHLISCFSAVLQELTQIDPLRIVLVDSAGTLEESDWANELHPKASGFRKIAMQCWMPALRRHGLA